MTPVPGFIDDAVRIVARITHPKAVAARVLAQPCEGGGEFKGFFRRRVARRADIQRTTAVVNSRVQRFANIASFRMGTVSMWSILRGDV